MAQRKPSTTFAKIPRLRQVGVSASAGTLTVQQIAPKGATTAHPTPPADPKGFKNYIAFDVAHGIYPNGSKVDPQRNISADLASSAAVRVAQINLYAHQDAIQLGYTWSPVKVTDLTNIKTVGDLMDLIVAHLS